MASDFKVVKMTYGRETAHSGAKDKFEYIPEGGVNNVIALWHTKQTEREMLNASPSKVLTCPRVVWLANHGVEPTNIMTWAVKQRMLLGRVLENKLAEQLAESTDGIKLLHHWKDDDYTITSLDEDERPFKFFMGEGETLIDGVPDYLLSIPYDGGRVVAISDAKTSRSDSFGYIEPNMPEVWNDGGWFKYKLQLTAYYMLCHSPEGKKWFEEHNLPLPTHCHLFSYALDDGIVRREFLWEPTQEDMDLVRKLTVRFNNAVSSKDMPDCTCLTDTADGFSQKFCKYGLAEVGKKICESCCSDGLVNMVKGVE